MSTQDLQWLLVRKSNSYLVKQKGLGRVFSREPGNLAALHSYKHSGVVNDKAIGITPAAGRGVVVTTRKQKVSPFAIKGAYSKTTVKGGARRVAGAVANVAAKNGYRADLRKDAVARATAIVNSQARKQRVPKVRAPRGANARKMQIAKAAAVQQDVRKERKVRPGFTPQEDRERFRPSRLREQGTPTATPRRTGLSWSEAMQGTERRAPGARSDSQRTPTKGSPTTQPEWRSTARPVRSAAVPAKPVPTASAKRVSDKPAKPEAPEPTPRPPTKPTKAEPTKAEPGKGPSPDANSVDALDTSLSRLSI
ncbi:hypothetical protein MNAN1_000317 [Malassezia nana]|uniref:Ribosomal eL28/Mak16 domain-containing protein n=1 Tax=Malassezia nana TaxID=180528 RepID=A0AAF0EIE0_9BASI|nr:hypothetical protein MNAN1_000317 [Malassezia nana]